MRFRSAIPPLTAAALLGLVLFAARPAGTIVPGDAAAHISRYFQEAVFVDRTLTSRQQAETTGMDAIMGGVAPHHIPTSIPLLADFYSRLRNSRNVDTFVVLGPDHFEKGRADVSVSEEAFITPFGRLEPDLDIIRGLTDSGMAVHDEAPFDDHSIHSQLLFIARLFPQARVVPIVFRSSSTNEFAELLGRRLAALSGSGTFIVASVDFSHYLNNDQAMPLDERSAQALARLEPKLAGLTEADSPQSLVALVAAVKEMGADASMHLGTYNSAEYSGTSDYTTGYVLQFFGKNMQ